MSSLQDQYDEAMFDFSKGDYDTAIAKLFWIEVQFVRLRITVANRQHSAPGVIHDRNFPAPTYAKLLSVPLHAQPDGKDVDSKDILTSDIAPPAEARPLITALNRYSKVEGRDSADRGKPDK